MRYEDLRDRLVETLRAVGLLSHLDRWPTETIDLGSTARKFKIYASPPGDPARPFHTSAEVAFRWSPFESARSYTREEDLLSELLGRERQPNTLPRLVRVDFVLHANLPWSSSASVPPPEVLDPWLAALEERLETHLPTGGVRSREGYGKGGREPVDFEVRPGHGGELSLRRIRVNAFWLLTVPRLWDDPKREARERGIEPELDTLCHRFRAAYDLWAEAIAALAAFLDYMPPGSPPPDPPVADPESVN